MPSFWPFQETANQPLAVEIPGKSYEAKDVSLFTQPWVSGTRANAYFGSVAVTESFKRSWDHTIDKALDRIQALTAVLGGNAVVGIEMAIDPFAEPATVSIVGTAAELVPMFG